MTTTPTSLPSAAAFFLCLFASACTTTDDKLPPVPPSDHSPQKPPHIPQHTDAFPPSNQEADALTPPAISDADALRIGQLIWRNESGGSLEGLVAWNVGEEFPSLGIGHFIWYPQNYRGPFEESFPALVRFLLKQGVAVPDWLRGPCPWPDRETFLRIKKSPQVEELRTLLAATVGLQARFAAERLRAALPKILEAAHPQSREHIRSRFAAVYAIPHGLYALIDYVNFKGEGVNPTERYLGQGWGLLQVLEAMPPRPADVHPSKIMDDFADAAWKVLQQRIRLSPPERNEHRWAAGWRNRCQTYRL